MLGTLDAALGESIESGASFRFGIHAGRHIEFEYGLSASSLPSAQRISKSLSESFAGQREKTSSSLLPVDRASTVSFLNVVLKVSRSRYDAWLTEVSARARSKPATLR